MVRWILALTFLWAAGCGKSFQEADAIYKDEKARLDAMHNECAEIGIQRARSRYRSDPDESLDEHTKRYGELLDECVAEVKKEHKNELSEQKSRVERAYRVREAAK